jgi:hypothetical protein
MDVCGTQNGGKGGAVNPEVGEYWRCTALEPTTRLRVGRGIAANETEAAVALWQQVKGRPPHAVSPPPVVSDGWGGTSGSPGASLWTGSRLFRTWTNALA